MNVLIREIDKKDCVVLAPLVNQFGHSNTDNLNYQYARIRDNDCYKTYVALADETVCGLISSVQWYGFGIEKPFMMITMIAVAEEQQHKGIGTKLIQRMESYAKEKNVFHIHLNSGFQRTGAHSFYERNGFEKGSYGFGKTI